MSNLWFWFFPLLLVAICLKQYSTLHNDSDSKHRNGYRLKSNKQFRTFQRWYIIIFILSCLSDWMMGPYVYKLYDSYNYSDYDKAVLFVFGYLTSGICGIFVGSIADHFGRKLMCIAFCILFTLSSIIMIHFGSNFINLLFGRLLSGISTSILHSVFESWMITHHNINNYSKKQLNQTFEIGNQVNAIVAILSGIVGSYGVSLYREYDILPSAPHCAAAFHVSCLVLMITMILIMIHWKENYGFKSKGNYLSSIYHSLDIIIKDKRILYIGIIQSGFESSLYIFIFMWTKFLDSVAVNGIDHGMIFAIMMVSCFIGTCIITIIRLKYIHFEWIQCVILNILCMICAISLLIVLFVSNFNFRLFMFVIYEISVGCYRPTLSSLRSRYVPHQYMATIINIFRVPLNIIVVAVLIHIHYLGDYVFVIASLLHFGCCFAAQTLAKIT